VANIVVLDLADDADRAALDRLHEAVGAHVATRLAWLQAWRDAYPQWQPWVLATSDGDGELRAAAPLARRRQAGLVRVRCLGHTELHQAPIVSVTTIDAEELASRLAAALQELRRPWTLHLRQLPVGDPFAQALSQRLPVVEIGPAAHRPVMELEPDADPRRVVSRNLRKAEARARNKIARAGLDFELRWITEPSAVAARFAEIRSVHRARDLQLRGRSLLDDESESAFYDCLLRRHLPALELLEARLDGELAAYLLWIRNDGARLVLDNRVAPRWSAFSAGLIANNAALRTAAEDPSVERLDWGVGVQRYKLQSSNRLIAHEELLAWSSRRTRWASAGRDVVRHRGRRFARPTAPVPVE
jgi:Acetyltransferase (GNAT) domain